MPTILTHAAVPLALGLGLGPRIISPRLLAAGVLASMLPDLDVVSFRLGIAYADELGHRGFSHSPLFALLVALAGAAAAGVLRSSFWRTFGFLLLATASHGLLDACTNGGLGVAFLWPWSGERFFAPFQVIEVSPLNPERFFSARGLAVLGSEVGWVWVPCTILAALLWAVRKRMERREA